MSVFTVTAAAMRPASSKQECFYCHQPIGTEHDPTCVTINKRVKLRMVVEYEVEVPASWSRSDIEFHRNKGSWCCDNALQELEAEADRLGCLCGVAKFEYLSDVSGPHLCE